VRSEIRGEAGSGSKMKTKGCIYYTDFHVSPEIQQVCLSHLKHSFKGEIVSVSLNAPLDLGKNIVVRGERSNTMMIRQIITALESLTTDYVFFTEHDVLYTPNHFEFTPEKDNVFYYNTNIYRWDYPHDRAITYDGLTALSQMCCNRKWALDHYHKRLKRLLDSGFDKEDGIGKMQPVWVRALGYEPGTKRRRIGGFSDDVSERWHSEIPNVDIRHGMTLSNPKTKLSQFKHLPVNFQEWTLDQIPHWNLKAMFNMSV
jgi:hypothetical protein